MEVKFYDRDFNESVKMLPDVDLLSNIVVLTLVLSHFASHKIPTSLVKEELELAVEKNSNLLNGQGFNSGVEYLNLCHKEYSFRYGSNHELIDFLYELEDYFFKGGDVEFDFKVTKISWALSSYPIKRYYTKRQSPSSVYNPIQGFEFSYKKNIRYWNCISNCLMQNHANI